MVLKSSLKKMFFPVRAKTANKEKRTGIIEEESVTENLSNQVKALLQTGFFENFGVTAEYPANNFFNLAAFF